MGFLDSILKDLGLIGSRKSRKRTTGLTLPDPGEIKEKLEEAVEEVSGLKDVPKALMDKLVEADGDFKEADKALRGTRIRGKKR